MAKRRKSRNTARLRRRPLLRVAEPVTIVRPDDLLVLRFGFLNLTLIRGKAARLERIDASAPAYLLAYLPGQNVAEEAFYESVPALPKNTKDEHPDPPSDDIPGHPPVRARLAGESRLVFRMPAAQASLPYTLEDLLEAARTWDLVVSPAALPAPPPRPVILLDRWPKGALLVQDAAFARAVRGPDLEAAARAAVARLQMQLLPLVAQEQRHAVPALLTEGLASAVAAVVGRHELFDRGLLKWLMPPRPARPHETAIECPWRVVVSPSALGAWAHALQPVVHDGRAELWHTRLGVRADDGGVDEAAEAQRVLRAIWSHDYEPEPTHDIVEPWFFRTSLSRRDRHLFVRLTAGYDEPDWTPQPVQVRRFMLSALGAWLDSHGQWEPPGASGMELEAWTHRATMGRDHYVRVVYKGYLFPFGHAASLVKVTERKFESRDGERIAYLRQRMFIIVRRRERRFPLPWQENDGRDFPFRAVRVLTTVTPDIDKPEDSTVAGLAAGYSDQAAFWPRVAQQDFQFRLEGEDAEGRVMAFTAPLLFVSVEGAKPLPPLAFSRDQVTGTLKPEYDGTAAARRERPFPSAALSFAPSAKPGDTALETVLVSFSALAARKDVILPEHEPAFTPVIDFADARCPALQRLLGTDALARVRYAALFKSSGFSGANRGEVFLELDGGYAVDFTAGAKGDKAGGLVTPNIAVSGLSRSVGPVGGTLAKVESAEFDPADFLPADAGFLGGLKLRDVLDKVVFDGPGSSESVPRITSVQEGDAVVTRLRWSTKALRSDPDDLFLPQDDAQLDLETTITAALPAPGQPPPAPVVATLAELVNFKINLFGFIVIWFDRLSFAVTGGSKPEVEIALNPGDAVVFGGPLEFVNELKKLIPFDGFGDSGLDVTPEGIKASYSLGLPPVAVGVFSLRNIKLGAGFCLPFTGDPATVRFAFCERQDPFVLTVCCFGGGGFFALAVDAGGLQELEASLEFRGELALDVGVASGSVYLRAGIYYHWKAGKAELTGFVEVGGRLSVLGLISVSLTFNMSLTYTDSGKVWGQATLVVEIEILFFSVSVSVTVEKQFKGSDADPLFVDLLPQPAMWEEYCEAFAAEEVFA